LLVRYGIAVALMVTGQVVLVDDHGQWPDEI
jgi:hypothetical protein